MTFPAPIPRRLLARLLALLALIPLAACGSEPEPQGPTVLAAASMQEALEEAADAWAAQGNLRPVLSFAGSGALARQIAIGAPADIFISADEDWMEWVESEISVREGTRIDLAANTLVLVAPKDSAQGFPDKGAWRAALGEGRLALADPQAVPAGRYGRAALIWLGAWPDIRDRLAETADVRAALALVKRGDAPLGIVYASDAQAEPGVRVVGPFPADSHDAIRYPMAMIDRSRNPGAAGFHAFLLSDQGQAILRTHGFDPVPAEEGDDDAGDDDDTGAAA